MKNKFIYGLIILSTMTAYVFFETKALGFLLAYEIVLVPILFCLAFFLGSRIKARIVIPYFHAQKNNEFPVEVHIKNKGFLPIPTAKVRLKCTNEFTGKVFHMEDTVMVDKSNTAILQFYLQSDCCGKLRFEIERIRVQDYLHLFSKTVKFRQTEDEIMILPIFHKIFLQNALPINSRYAFEQFSHTKSGEDPSEVFDVHTFRPGDTMQRMHWKLTAKTNEYLVKEFSMPLEHMVYIFLDFYCEDTSMITQEYFDRFLEILASLSWSMMDRKISHMVVWQNGIEQEINMVFVEYEKDVYNMLEQVCDGKLYNEQFDLETIFMHKHGYSELKNKLRIDMYGRFYRDDICTKQFGNDAIEKELIEWKPEI